MIREWCQRNWLGWAVRGLILAGAIGVVLPDAAAQIRPDRTLGAESSRLTRDREIEGQPGDRIGGGARRGANLFHSFSEFNVNEGQRVYFENPAGVRMIFSRVTGRAASQIRGTLGVAGTADLFLLNPNGILFGPNARLDVRGSFVATTADALEFGDRGRFSASAAAVPSDLLTISPSAFLFNQLNPAAIVNRSRVPAVDRAGNPILTPGGNPVAFGLQVGAGQNLLLLGGAVNLERAGLFAPAGHVELAAMGGRGRVELRSLSDGWRLQIPDAAQRAAISLLGGSAIGTAAGNGGEAGTIAIRAGELRAIGDQPPRAIATESPGSVILDAQGGNGGAIDITADSLELTNAGLFTNGNASGVGNGGDITLKVQDRANLTNSIFYTTSFGTGQGGDFRLTATAIALNQTDIFANLLEEASGGNVRLHGRDTVSLTNTSIYSQTSFSAAPGAGDAGDMSVRAGNFIWLQDSRITASTNNAGNAGNISLETPGSLRITRSTLTSNTTSGGDAGRISIRAADAVLLEGASGVSTSTGALIPGEFGEAGRIEIQTNRLTIADHSYLLTGTIRNQPGGDIAIAASRVELSNGGKISTQTASRGAAGNMRLRGIDRLRITGADSGLFASTTPDSSGNGGSVEVQAGLLILDQLAQISTQTANGEGGDIRLDLQNLLLRARSSISTTAGTERAGGNGGNITIAADNLIAVPSEDADISADAFTGRGGEVNITAQLLGIEPRLQNTGLSDITASSQFGIDGVIQINSAVVDPSQGLIELPATVVDASRLIAQACPTYGAIAANQASEFVITGRGGLPPAPADSGSSNLILTDWARLDQSEEAPAIVAARPAPPAAAPVSAAAIVEAQGWVRDAQGHVVLVAQRPARGGLAGALVRCEAVRE